MALHNIGFTISAILLFLGLVCAILGIYFADKAQNPYDSQIFSSTTKLSTKYWIGFGISLGLSLFVLSTTENGFSWDAVCGSVGLVVLCFALVFLNNFIHSKTIAYLHKRNILPLSPQFEERAKMNEDEKKKRE